MVYCIFFLPLGFVRPRICDQKKKIYCKIYTACSKKYQNDLTSLILIQQRRDTNRILQKSIFSINRKSKISYHIQVSQKFVKCFYFLLYLIELHKYFCVFKNQSQKYFEICSKHYFIIPPPPRFIAVKIRHLMKDNLVLFTIYAQTVSFWSLIVSQMIEVAIVSYCTTTASQETFLPLHVILVVLMLYGSSFITFFLK